MDRNHYEAAFASMLRDRRVPFVRIDERRRGLSQSRSLKNADFLVTPTDANPPMIVDVKGRRFPTGARGHYWKNWSTSDELQSMASWEQLFGAGSRAWLVFAYWVVGRMSPLAPELLTLHEGQAYAFLAVSLRDYLAFSKTISPKWGTVAIPTATFRSVARPFEEVAGLAGPNLTASAG